MKINVAMTIPCTEAEGPGKRFTLWVQGCPLRCPGCCNQEMLPFEDKAWTSVDDILGQILESQRDNGIDGVVFLGGEPFSQAEALADLAAKVRSNGLNVMIYSGVTYKALKRGKMPGARDLLAQTDLLVAGPFKRDHLDHTRRWIGSTNQTTHNPSGSGAYADLLQEWDTSPNTLEVRIVGGKLVVNGSPFLLDKLGTVTHLTGTAP